MLGYRSAVLRERIALGQDISNICLNEGVHVVHRRRELKVVYNKIEGIMGGLGETNGNWEYTEAREGEPIYGTDKE